MYEKISRTEKPRMLFEQNETSVFKRVLEDEDSMFELKLIIFVVATLALFYAGLFCWSCYGNKRREPKIVPLSPANQTSNNEPVEGELTGQTEKIVVNVASLITNGSRENSEVNDGENKIEPCQNEECRVDKIGYVLGCSRYVIEKVRSE